MTARRVKRSTRSSAARRAFQSGQHVRLGQPNSVPQVTLGASSAAESVKGGSKGRSQRVSAAASGAGNHHGERQQIPPNRIEDEAQRLEYHGAEEGGVRVFREDHRRSATVSFVEEQRVAAIAIDRGPVGESEALARVRQNAKTIERGARNERGR
jgi:hypothetical protein